MSHDIIDKRTRELAPEINAFLNEAFLLLQGDKFQSFVHHPYTNRCYTVG